jgi:hypothetical protein
VHEKLHSLGQRDRRIPDAIGAHVDSLDLIDW